MTTRSLLHSPATGVLELAEIPSPRALPGQLLVASRVTVVSPGTERAARSLAKRSLVGKALERPDQVSRVLEKLRTDGLAATLDTVRSRLEEPMPLGYSSAGAVLEVGDGVQGFAPGDRVASNGPHAELVTVPSNLCARIPDALSFDQAAFGILGTIALHAVRLSQAALGESVLVVGLGLVGQLTVALLRAAGCRVLGTDPDAERCRIAERMGAAEARPGLDAAAVEALTGGLGADAVLVAAASASSAPATLAISAVRRKGRIVIVGDVGLELSRRDLFFKEAEVVVSRSYGPGRYDRRYEEKGYDYPPAYVRWTEQRNLQAVLDAMASGALDVTPLITHRFAFDRALDAYALIEERREPSLGVVLTYEERSAPERRSVIVRSQPPGSGSIGIGVLGAGQFARSVLLPALRSLPDLRPIAISSARGVSAQAAAQRFGFAIAASDEAELLEREDVQAVFVLTRHHLHAQQVVRALRAGKHVFVEKPLCLSLEELAEVEAALVAAGDRVLMVGFNRRFAPMARAVREHFAGTAEPPTVAVRFNAGALPADHWTQDPEVGGGRILGEACHGVDLATYLVGAPPVMVFATAPSARQVEEIGPDQCCMTLRHANGGTSTVTYLTGGDSGVGKERVEVFGGGRAAVIDDFRELTLAAGGRGRTRRARRDKGHQAQLAAFVESLRQGGGMPVPWEETRAVTAATLLAQRSLREGRVLALAAYEGGTAADAAV